MVKKMRSRWAMSALAAVVLSMSVLFTIVSQRSQAQTSSAGSSQPQATPVSPSSSPTPDDAGLRAACAETLDELLKARVLIRDQDDQLERYHRLNALTDQIEAGLKNLRTLDAEEKQHLRDAVTAADKEIAALKGEVAVLKKKQMTFLKKAKWFVIGGVVGVAVYAVFGRK